MVCRKLFADFNARLGSRPFRPSASMRCVYLGYGILARWANGV